MRRARLRLWCAPLVTTVLLLAVTTACGDDGAGKVEPKAWATKVCQALGPWRDQITGLNAQAGQDMAAAKNPTQTRESLVKLLAGGKTASEQARALIVSAGAPKIKDGTAIADRFARSLSDVRDAYAKAEQAIEALPMADAKAFYDGVQAAITTLNTEYDQAGVNTSTLASAELRKDFDEVPACNPG